MYADACKMSSDVTSIERSTIHSTKANLGSKTQGTAPETLDSAKQELQKLNMSEMKDEIIKVCRIEVVANAALIRILQLPVCLFAGCTQSE